MTKVEKAVREMTANLLDAMLIGEGPSFEEKIDAVVDKLGVQIGSDWALIGEYRRAMSSLADDLRAQAAP